MRKVFVKYNLIRVRMKISFTALKRMHTIGEHWLRQIVSTFRFLRDSGQIKILKWKTIEEEELLNLLMKGEI